MYIDTKDDFICVQRNTDESSFNFGKCVCTDHTKRESEVLSLYPLLPNKMSMERDSNGCCIMCILVIAIISKRIWECVQLEIKRRKKSESYLRRRHCRG